MRSAIANKNQSSAVTARVKRLLVRNVGVNGIRVLSRALGIASDAGGASTVTKDGFIAALATVQITLSADDLAALWAEYDRQGSGHIDPVDIITSLRCSGISVERRTLIQRAWSTLRKNPFGAVDLDTFRDCYVASAHPDVVCGSKTVAEVKNEFESAFSAATNPAGSVSSQEFEQYFSGVSATIEEDDTFAALMRGCWSIVGADAYFTSTLALTAGSKIKSFYATQPIPSKRTVAENMQRRTDLAAVITQHRNTLLGARLGFRGLGRLLRARDVEGTGYLNTEDFLDVLWQNRLYVQDQSLLQLLDSNNDNTVDVNLYLNSVIPTLPPARISVLERLWAKLPTDAKNHVHISVIHKQFRPADGNALNLFLDAWDKRQVPGGLVSFQELGEWYAPLSTRTPMDAVFEQTVVGEWQ